MSWQSVPWMVGGGAEHPPEVARLLAYAALGGAEGVVGINDCMVRPLATPGGSVRVSTGGAVLLNRSTGGGQQSYVGRCETEDIVDVTPQGAGSTRYDLVVVRVMDPQYPPWPAPADPVVGPYIESFIVSGVPSTTETASELNLGYPAIALARLAIPASTATITGSMIADLRKVVRPRRERFLRTTALPSGADDQNNADADGEIWPDASQFWTMDIPEWATEARVVGTYAAVGVGASANSVGELWARIGGQDTEHVKYDTAGGSATFTRQTFVVADDIPIPASIRGTTQPVHLRAKRTSGTIGLTLDYASAVALDVEFVEKAELA